VVALYARRALHLVHEGVLEAKGDLRRPRWSEIRLQSELGQMEHKRKLGDEPFQDGDQSLGFCVRDFWQWAASDLVSNAMRGRVAEFLVARAVGAAGGIRNEWDSYDVATRSGLRIEVKSAAYLQTWGQKAESAISFAIGPTIAWDPETGDFEPEHKRRRQATVYVFALLAHRDKKTLNPMDVRQWEFRLVRTSELDAKCAGQKRISLSSLERLKIVRATYAELAECLAQFEM